MYYVLVREARGYPEYVCGGDPAYFSADRTEAALFDEDALALLDRDALRTEDLVPRPAGEEKRGAVFTPLMPHYRLRFARTRAGALVRRETAYLAVREEQTADENGSREGRMESI